MYSDEFYYASEALFGSMVGFAGLGMAVNLLAVALSVTSYVLLSLGLYRIATRRGIKHGWLAWLPVGNLWILGSISDGYQSAVNGRKSDKRKILLVLNILMYILFAIMIVGVVMMLVNVFQFTLSNMDAMGMADEKLLMEDLSYIGDVLGPLFAALAAAYAVFGLCVAMTVVEYMALYDLFASCDPGNKTLFLVLGLVLSLFGLPLTSVFVFVCRNKDLGMPHRRQQVSPLLTDPEIFQQPEDSADP